MRRIRVLFVDDLLSARKLYLRALDEKRFEVSVAETVEEAEEKIREELPQVVVTDLRMPGVDGLEGLKRFHDIDPELPVILITAFGSVETAVQAMRHGAYDYVRKPFDPGEVEILIERATRHRDLEVENKRLRSEIGERFKRDNIVWASSAMRSVMNLVDRVAQTDFTVLIQGESGTGKDVFAKLIHHSSPRSKRPYISLNCSAIPEHLLESELFGHDKGAFSGAERAREGFFAKADGGTLFLDEIGDMSMNLQPKLLRVLQDGEFYPVGSRKLLKVDVRVICASNHDIPALVERGDFREDLYYRINTIKIALPPLRERPDEIPLFVERFLEQNQSRAPGAPTRVSPGALRRLLEYGWPGNVRELEHAIARATLVCEGDEIQPQDLAPEICGGDCRPVLPEADTYREAKRQFELRFFEALLARTEGNVQAAAEIAGLHRTTLYEKLTKLGLEISR